MNKQNRTLLDKAVGFLTALHFKPENIMVTGSIALDMQGLLPKNQVAHDVDILLNTDDQSWRCLKLLETISKPADKKNSDYPDKKNFVVFSFSDVILNIWKNDWKEESSIKDAETGVYVATAKGVINAKKAYNREKDVRDITYIIKDILN